MLGIFWLMKVKDPIPPKVNQAEIDYIRSGGGEPSCCKRDAENNVRAD